MVLEDDVDDNAEEWIIDNCRKFRYHDSINMKCSALLQEDYIEPGF